MSDQPERPIERLLRKCGRRRLPSETFELHPANRRLLQDEVARTYRHRAESRFGWLRPHLLPRLALGFGAFAVVGSVAWLLLKPNHPAAPSLIARNDKALVAPTLANAPMAAPSLEPTPTLQSNLTVADTFTTAAQEPANSALAVQHPISVDASSVVSMNLAEQELSREVAAKSELADARLAGAPQPTAPAGAALRYGLASPTTPSLKQAYQPTTVQSFVREQAAQLKISQQPAKPPILVSFRLERTGSDVRIIDQDGSIYLGTLTHPQRQVALKAGRVDKPVSSDLAGAVTPTRTPSPTNSPEEYTFRVTGTNRTLGELISFGGRWSALTNASPTLAHVSKDINGGVMDRSLAPAASAGAMSVGGRISGTAIIQGRDSIAIEAVSAQP